MGETETSAYQYRSWTAVEPEHPLAALDGERLASGRLRVFLGPRSRFGARYFAALLENDSGELSREPIATGLHNSGPLPTYNWIELAETRESISFPTGDPVQIAPAEIETLFRLLARVVPTGGHLMVEYDSPQRAETARALAQGVPAIATPLGEMLFRAGFGAHFKDWQIAEGGSEGPRKLQAYLPPTEADAARWRSGALRQLESFKQRPGLSSGLLRAALARTEELLPLLRADAPPPSDS